MKLQDIIFLLLLTVIIFSRNPRLSVSVGLFLLVFSVPLFASWIFFTAERFAEYAAAFFLLSIILYVVKIGENNES